jgi:hypothetical protein
LFQGEFALPQSFRIGLPAIRDQLQRRFDG